MTTRHSEIVELVQANYRLDPSNIYCSITGKAIGFVGIEDFESLVDSLSGTVEEASGDLAMRSLASMRPSMRWNKMRMETIEEMRKSAPIETMAYLLNRLFEPPQMDKRVGKQTGFMELHLNRIHLYSALESSPNEPEAFGAIMLMLLELDSKLGLRTESTPFTCKQLLKADNLFLWLKESLEPWHAERVAYHLNCEREAQFFSANPGARRAYHAQWLATAPKSKATIAKEAKQKDANFFDSLLDELINPASTLHKPESRRIDPDLVAHVSGPIVTNRSSTKMPSAWGKKS